MKEKLGIKSAVKSRRKYRRIKTFRRNKRNVNEEVERRDGSIDEGRERKTR